MKKTTYSQRSLFNNKKGLLSGLTDTIMGIINFIKDIIPRPVQFLLFLALILVIAQTFTYLYNISGVFCNTADQPVKLQGNPITYITLIGEIPDPKTVGLDALNPEEFAFTGISNEVTLCSNQQQKGYYIDKNGIQTNFSNPTWFYDGQVCTDCNKVKVYSYTDVTANRVGGFTKEFCVGDTFRLNDTEKSASQSFFCDTMQWSCQPPTHYYYKSSLNTYLCGDSFCTSRTLGDQWNDKLKTYNAQLMYPEITTGTDKSSNGFIGFKCQDFHPKLAVFGIDIFDYKMWLVILIIIILIWALKIASNLQ